MFKQAQIAGQYQFPFATRVTSTVWCHSLTRCDTRPAVWEVGGRGVVRGMSLVTSTEAP